MSPTWRTLAVLLSAWSVAVLAVPGGELARTLADVVLSGIVWMAVRP